jgi:hypothetical protein
MSAHLTFDIFSLNNFQCPVGTHSFFWCPVDHMPRDLTFSIYVGQKKTKKGSLVPSFERIPQTSFYPSHHIPLSPTPETSSSATLRLGQYMFSKEMKKKMTKRPKGIKDGRRKQVIFCDFQEDLFHLLFPQATRVGKKGWIQTFITEEAINHHFGGVKKSWSDGISARLSTPLSVFFSTKKRLRILFYYTVEDHNGTVTWITSHAHEFDMALPTAHL